MRIEIEVLEEAGFNSAVGGICLSYNTEPSLRVAQKLAKKGGGHNKFLESIMAWLEIRAPRYWWQQFDSYRVGVTKQSESTMHTLMRKKSMDYEDFSIPVDMGVLSLLNHFLINQRFEELKGHLPESFIQKRVVCVNYKTLYNMYVQRKYHKLGEWREFCNFISTNLGYWKELGLNE